jgi:tetratricopeptide (TPR) repeat protein
MAELAAYHYVQAVEYGDDSPETSARAFHLLLEAGEAALARAAYSSAQDLLVHALELAPDEATRGRALLACGHCHESMGNLEAALDLLQEAQATGAGLGDPRLGADALGWQARVYWLEGRWADAVAASELAVATLSGLPESPQLARALARRSQIEMLRGLPQAAEHALEAVDVARRVGDRFAEANALVNYTTARATQGFAPSEADTRETIELAIEAGAHDEGFRALVNYVWGASSFVQLDELERSAAALVEPLSGFHAAETYEHYLQVSLAKLVWVPSGRWDCLDAVIAEPEGAIATSNRMVWLEVVAGLALRRGDLTTAGEALKGFRGWALGSDEPQRVLPLAGVAIPHAVLTGDDETVASLTEVVLDFAGRSIWTFYVSIGLPRGLARAGRDDLLRDLLAAFERERGDATPAGRVVALAGRGLLAHAEGRTAAAVALLAEAVEGATQRGARYEAACLELDHAAALEAAGDGGAAEAARSRARDVLVPLGCVNPV